MTTTEATLVRHELVHLEILWTLGVLAVIGIGVGASKWTDRMTLEACGSACVILGAGAVTGWRRYRRALRSAPPVTPIALLSGRRAGGLVVRHIGLPSALGVLVPAVALGPDSFGLLAGLLGGGALAAGTLLVLLAADEKRLAVRLIRCPAPRWTFRSGGVLGTTDLFILQSPSTSPATSARDAEASILR